MKQIGKYFIVAGTLLSLFPNLAYIGSLLESIGIGLEKDQPTIGPIYIGGDLTTIGRDLVIAGGVLLVFGNVAAQVGAALESVGLALELGQGTVGPIRIAAFALTFAFTPATGKPGHELTLTVAPWKGV